MANGTCSFDGCDDAVIVARGLCSKHYQWLRKRGALPKGPKRSKWPVRTWQERFWPKVNKTETCWLWTGATSVSGYGSFAGSPYGTKAAHRIAYESVVGPIPEGLQLDHLCRVRNCVNPAHLEPVTARENAYRGYAPHMVLHRQGVCLYGHPVNDENTYWRNGWASCRACRRKGGRQR